jgi:serine/threonine protein kinase
VAVGQPGFRLVAEPRNDGVLEFAPAVRDSDGAEVTIRVVVARLDRVQLGRARDEAAALDDVLAVSNSPFVLPLLHHDRDESGRPFLVTARRGRSLAEELAARGPLPVAEARDAVLQAAGGLEVLHRNGIAHQAISPETLLRQPSGHVVLDCPQLPVLAEIAAATTDGTGHEPPEVLAGGDWAPRGEVYALASTLWTLLTGRPPFSGSRAERVLFAGQDISGRLPDGAAELDTALRRALRADPAARPESVTAFASGLRERETPVAPGKTDEVSTAVPATARMLGEYELLSPIGRGSMGTVWRARRSAGGELVAAKLLHPELVTDPDTLMRLVREASALRDLEHPHLVRMRELYIATGRGEAAVIMDLVDGVDLRHLLAAGELGRAEGMRLLAEVSSGLAAVHDTGVVHRDLKPENILVCEENGGRRALLTDFGLAKAIGNPTVTQVGYVPGTPAYLAPELVNREAPTPASDMYALGITAYEVLTRRRPFAGTSTQEVLRQHQLRQPARPPDLPDSVWTFVAACLAKDPRARPTALDAAGVLPHLAREIALGGPDPALEPTEAQQTLPVPYVPPPPVDPYAPVPGQAAGLTTGTGAELLPPQGESHPPTPRSRWPILAAAVVALAAIGVTAGILFGHYQAGTSPPASTPPTQAKTTVQVTVVNNGGRITVSWSPESGSLPGLSSFVVVRDGHPVGEPLPPNVFSFQDPDSVTTGCYRVFAIGVPPPSDPPPAPACIH